MSDGAKNAVLIDGMFEWDGWDGFVMILTFFFLFRYLARKRRKCFSFLEFRAARLQIVPFFIRPFLPLPNIRG